MPISDDDSARLKALLETLTDRQLSAIKLDSDRLLRLLQDTNSEMPAVREFLKARGLSSVRELSKRGIGELTAHLEQTLRLLRN